MNSYPLSVATRMLAATGVLLLANACGSGSESKATADSPSSPAANAALTGTWHLVSIQSMDDTIGTTTPEPGQSYVMTLAADGTAAFQLNCNRATSSWSSTSTSQDTGSVEFGVVGMTRALCPPPSLDERIARDLEYVRGYLLRDGQLHLSLFADGGIYTWAPAES